MNTSNQQADPANVRLKKIVTFFSWLFIVVEAIVLVLLNWRGVLPAVAWNIADRSWNRDEIRAAILGSQGDPWFIAHKSWGNNRYELRHITGKQVVSWKLPASALKQIMFAAIAEGKDKDHPWLILGDELAHWDGSQWVFTPMPLQADLESYSSCASVASRGATVWGIDQATKSSRLIRLDLDREPIQAHEILLPEGLSSQNYRFYCLIPTNGNGLLAVLTDGTQQDFYQLENSAWQRITSFQVEKDALGISDVTSDSGGRLWVLLGRWAPGVHVGKYDPQANTWTWYEIEVQPEVTDRVLDYGHIAVDGLGRVWLSADQYKPLSATDTTIGSHNYETHAVGVFEETTDHKLVELRHYTTANSSLQTSPLARIIVGPDQRIWTWDQQLVWMDSSQQELPQPATRWFLTLTDYRVLMGLLLVIFVPFSIVAIGLRIRQRGRRGDPLR